MVCFVFLQIHVPLAVVLLKPRPAGAAEGPGASLEQELNVQLPGQAEMFKFITSHTSLSPRPGRQDEALREGGAEEGRRFLPVQAPKRRSADKPPPNQLQGFRVKRLSCKRPSGHAWPQPIRAGWCHVILFVRLRCSCFKTSVTEADPGSDPNPSFKAAADPPQSNGGRGNS